MMSFLSSPEFFYWALGVGLGLGIIAVLWHNVRWTPRGVTPPAMVATLKAGLLDFARENWRVLLGVAGVAVVLLAIATVESLDAPAPASVGAFTAKYWLWMTIVLVVAYGFSISAVPAKYHRASILAVTSVAILLGGSLMWHGVSVWWTTSTIRAPGDCTYSRPCEPAKDLVAVPTGKKPCFDPPIWADKKRFGFSVITSTETKEHQYLCTAEQVQLGRCKEGPITAFRFNPEAGQKAPRHWFVDGDKPFCG